MRETEDNEKAGIRNMQSEKKRSKIKNHKNPETLAAVHTHTQVFQKIEKIQIKILKETII